MYVRYTNTYFFGIPWVFRTSYQLKTFQRPMFLVDVKIFDRRLLTFHF